MRKLMVDLMVLLTGLLSMAYVLNFTFGLAELLPDNLPVVGNLDEATATALFLTCLSYFGISGGKLVDVLRVLAGKPPLALPPAKQSARPKEPV